MKNIKRIIVNGEECAIKPEFNLTNNSENPGICLSSAMFDVSSDGFLLIKEAKHLEHYDNLGCIKVGTKGFDVENAIAISTSSSGYVGFMYDSDIFTQQLPDSPSNLGLKVGLSPDKPENSLFSIPLTTAYDSENDYNRVGIFANSNQFEYDRNKGLNIKEDILGGATKVTWNSSSNMNNFRTPGIYDIYGERTRQDDNLPIQNASSGHSIAAKLTVVASTLQPANDEICITQFLQLSNRIGEEGNMYVRTYNQNNGSITGAAWSPWQKQMGMVETLINSNTETVGQEIFTGAAQKVGEGLNGMIDNGMYSGIYIDNILYTGNGNYYALTSQPTFVETFVLVVINDYAATGKLNLPRHITQLKYAVDAITGQSTVKKRVGTGNDTISWGDWEDIGGSGSNEPDITNAVKAYDLPTIIEQRILKEGVTYKIVCERIELPKIDTNSKINEHLATNSLSLDDTIILSIRYYQYHVIIDCIISGEACSYFKYIIQDINTERELVKVSANMVEL